MKTLILVLALFLVGCEDGGSDGSNSTAPTSQPFLAAVATNIDDHIAANISNGYPAGAYGLMVDSPNIDHFALTIIPIHGNDERVIAITSQEMRVLIAQDSRWIETQESPSDFVTHNYADYLADGNLKFQMVAKSGYALGDFIQVLSESNNFGQYMDIMIEPSLAIHLDSDIAPLYTLLYDMSASSNRADYEPIAEFYNN